MNISFDESKIVKIILEGDKDNYISLSLKDGEVTGMEIISKKDPKAYIEGASVLDKLDSKKQAEIDKELIDKSHDIALKIKAIRSGRGSGSVNSVGEEIKEKIMEAQKEFFDAQDTYEKKVKDAEEKIINPEAKKIMNVLDSEEFKSSPVAFKENSNTMNLMKELKEEAEKDFEEAWKNNENEVEFQDGVTEKEQQILDIVSETPIDKLSGNEKFLKKIGEYKNLMKSKSTKLEASKKFNDILNNGGIRTVYEPK